MLGDEFPWFQKIMHRVNRSRTSEQPNASEDCFVFWQKHQEVIVQNIIFMEAQPSVVGKMAAASF
jgi:hypothetical protein